MRYSLTQTVPPTCEPITVDELKMQARIDADLTDEDGLLEAYIVAARTTVEQETGRQLMRCTYVLRLDAFPCDDCLVFPKPLLAGVTSVQYVDTDGTTQTWASSNYVVDPYADPGRLALAYGVSWPSTRDIPNAVIITYTAGYATDPKNVPQPLRLALLLMGAELYARREMSIDRRLITSELPLSVKRLLYPYRTAAVLVA